MRRSPTPSARPQTPLDGLGSPVCPLHAARSGGGPSRVSRRALGRRHGRAALPRIVGDARAPTQSLVAALRPRLAAHLEFPRGASTRCGATPTAASLWRQRGPRRRAPDAVGAGTRRPALRRGDDGRRARPGHRRSAAGRCVEPPCGAGRGNSCQRSTPQSRQLGPQRRAPDAAGARTRQRAPPSKKWPRATRPTGSRSSGCGRCVEARRGRSRSPRRGRGCTSRSSIEPTPSSRPPEPKGRAAARGRRRRAVKDTGVLAPLPQRDQCGGSCADAASASAARKSTPPTPARHGPADKSGLAPRRRAAPDERTRTAGAGERISTPPWPPEPRSSPAGSSGGGGRTIFVRSGVIVISSASLGGSAWGAARRDAPRFSGQRGPFVAAGLRRSATEPALRGSTAAG